MGCSLPFLDGHRVANDNGSQNAVSPSQMGAPCAQMSGYEGWYCLDKAFEVSGTGVSYSVQFRWNRVKRQNRASIVWVLGGNGFGNFRTEYGAKDSQDFLDRYEAMRSIEIVFVDTYNGQKVNSPYGGGYWKVQTGYKDPAEAYTKALEFLIASGIANGEWITHIGGSNGTMLAAYALAYHGAERYLARVIFNAGPFGGDMGRSCLDPDYHAYIGLSESQEAGIRGLVDFWNGWFVEKYCTNQISPPGNLFAERSLLGTGAVRQYPKLAVHVIMGEKDGYDSWIIASSKDWYSNIEAAEKTFDLIPGLGHEMEYDLTTQLARRPPSGSAD